MRIDMWIYKLFSCKYVKLSKYEINTKFIFQSTTGLININITILLYFYVKILTFVCLSVTALYFWKRTLWYCEFRKIIHYCFIYTNESINYLKLKTQYFSKENPIFILQMIIEIILKVDLVYVLMKMPRILKDNAR